MNEIWDGIYSRMCSYGYSTEQISEMTYAEIMEIIKENE